MGNELAKSSNKSKYSHQQADVGDLKADVPVLTGTFVEHATNVVDNKKYLTKSDVTNSLFVKVPAFGLAFIKNYFPEENQEEGIDLYSFITVGSQFSSSSVGSSNKSLTAFYADIFSSDGNTLSRSEVTSLMIVFVESSLAVAKLPSSTLNLDRVTLAFINTILKVVEQQQKQQDKAGESIENISLVDFESWMTRHLPSCCRDLHDHVVYRMFKRTSVKKTVSTKVQEPSDNSELYQSCLKNESFLGISGLWLVSSVMPFSYIPSSEFGTVPIFSRVLENNGWHILYNSNKQGLSANGFSHKVLGYPASTLTFIKFGNFLLVLGLDVEWMESHERRGKYDCFLYQLQPEFKIIQRDSENCVFFNLTSRTIKKGIQFAKDRKIILEINSDFDAVIYNSENFNLSGLEVWGCGGPSNFDKYIGQKLWEKNNTAKHQNRKLTPDEWKDSPDRMLLDYGGVETDHAKRGDL